MSLGSRFDKVHLNFTSSIVHSECGDIEIIILLDAIKKGKKTLWIRTDVTTGKIIGWNIKRTPPSWFHCDLKTSRNRVYLKPSEFLLRYCYFLWVLLSFLTNWSEKTSDCVCTMLTPEPIYLYIINPPKTWMMTLKPSHFLLDRTRILRAWWD